MNDIGWNHDRAEDSAAQPADHEEVAPRFGLVDVVEAFTAMRHEWRGQTKESRALAASLDEAVTRIQQLEENLLARAAPASDAEIRPFVEALTEAEHQIARAVVAVDQAEATRLEQVRLAAEATEIYYRGMNPLARWFARGLMAFVTRQYKMSVESGGSSASEGLGLLLDRLRRKMNQLHIERIDTLGQPFDPHTMNAIGTAQSAEYPPGHVAEQLSPGYRWRGEVLQFAAVRVAAS